MLIDKFVIAVMVYSICVILFRSGMIYQKRETMSKNRRIAEIILLAPYLSAVITGIVLFFLKEVVV
jgi:NhaP-type Na+/H+ or K+/H+ antiporter